MRTEFKILERSLKGGGEAGREHHCRYRVDISRSFAFIEFGRLPRLVEFSGFLRYRIEIGGNLRLVDLGGFSRF